MVFAERTLAPPGRRRSPPVAKKARLQRAIFPEGLSCDRSGYRTPLTSDAFAACAWIPGRGQRSCPGDDGGRTPWGCRKRTPGQGLAEGGWWSWIRCGSSWLRGRYPPWSSTTWKPRNGRHRVPADSPDDGSAGRIRFQQHGLPGSRNPSEGRRRISARPANASPWRPGDDRRPRFVPAPFVGARKDNLGVGVYPRRIGQRTDCGVSCPRRPAPDRSPHAALTPAGH